MVWFELVVCAAFIIWAGFLLWKYGDVIAEKSGLGRVWIGAILIAGVTSLPELASGISAVAWLKAPNLAAGAALGSCLFNLVLIAVMDLAYQPGRVLAKAQAVHEVLKSAPRIEAEELDTAMREGLRAQRSTLLGLQRDGVISDDVLKQLSAEIDVDLDMEWTNISDIAAPVFFTIQKR